MKTIKSNWQGKCCVCNSDSIDYGVVVFTDGQCYFPWTCKQCGQTGEEWFDMQFIGHNIDFDDECLEIEDYMVGSTIKTKEERKNEFIDILIQNALYIAYDNEGNFGDVYCSQILDDIQHSLGLWDYTLDDLIKDVLKDDRVDDIGGITGGDVIDIIFTDSAMKTYISEREG